MEKLLGQRALDMKFECVTRFFLVEQTALFVVFFLNLSYLLPLNNRQKIRYELYPHFPCNRSLLL